MNAYRSEPMWVDNGRNPNGSPAMKQIWAIRGPAPFGNLVAESEEQATAAVDRLNADASMLGTLRGLYPDDYCRDQTELAGLAVFACEQPKAFNVGMRPDAPLNLVAAAVQLRVWTTTLRAQLEAASKHGGDLLQAAPSSVSRPLSREHLELVAMLERKFEMQPQPADMLELRGDLGPAQETVDRFGCSMKLGRRISRAAAQDWTAVAEAERETQHWAAPERYPDAKQTAVIIEAVLRDAAERCLRVRWHTSQDTVHEGLALFDRASATPVGIRVCGETIIRVEVLS